MNDTQAKLVYASEFASPSWEKPIPFHTTYDAKECFKSILKSKVWANKFKVERELKLDFVDDDEFSGRYWPAGIYLDSEPYREYNIPYGCVVLHNPGRHMHILLHEMTHHIITERFPKAESHGPQFAWHLVAMVGCFFSKMAAEGLALSMKIHGVKARK